MESLSESCQNRERQKQLAAGAASYGSIQIMSSIQTKEN